MLVEKPQTLEVKLSRLAGFGELEVDYQGIDSKENHSTFGGQAKRYYYYEGGSNISSPVISSRTSIFFIGAYSYVNGGGTHETTCSSVDTALLAVELRSPLGRMRWVGCRHPQHWQVGKAKHSRPQNMLHV